MDILLNGLVIKHASKAPPPPVIESPVKLLVLLHKNLLIDCDNSNNNGCEGGLKNLAFEWVINNGGSGSAADYPYTASQGTLAITTRHVNHKVVTIDGYQDVAEEESALLCTVAQQPVSVDIGRSIPDFQLYTCCTRGKFPL
ncbi:cysteine proteinase mucunain-like [Lycium ferocissimum]|uniref:cysteine proteinase mucunain-like n=1 Tax=Lycium ferocissimum TaxID=112874 RepID=UPI002814CA00|nr:cysteine proteinase mucunain-like [Lycium ferocissimum]